MVYDHDNEELVKELQRERDEAVGALARLAAHYGPVPGLCGELQASEYEECIKGYVEEYVKSQDLSAPTVKLLLASEKHLKQRLADALRVLASIGDQIRCDSPIQSQHCDECAEQLSDQDILSESIRCEDCEATRRIEIAADEAEGRAVDAAVERDQARRHGEVIE